MLTVFSLNNAKEAASYYENDNYYTKDSIEAIAATHWWGKGAEELGLKDYVDPDDFVELLSGNIDKNTTIRRIRHDGGVTHKPGYDLTFSAPKSVSMLAEIGEDERIYEAHNAAVNSALEYLQSRVAQYRKTVDSNTSVELGDNLTVAKFRHDTSRSVDETIDCQLHTHCIVVNAIKGNDGKWRSLYEKPIFDFKMTGGMIYRSALAMELKKLGYSIEKTRSDGLFEVSGFTRDEIESFSKRRVKILEVMQENGLFGSHAAQAVTLKTRESKFEINREKLKEHWISRAKEANIDIDSVVLNAKKKSKSRHLYQQDQDKNNGIAIKSIGYALDHLGERQSVFQEKDIIRVSLQYALGELKIEDIHSAISELKDKNKLIFLGNHKHQDIYTTSKVLERENRIIEVMQAGKNEYDSIAPPEATELYVQELIDNSDKRGIRPTECQIKAIKFLAESTDQVVGVQGYAGTGKTTMLKSICELSREAGIPIRGAAPSASAADVLRGDTAITTETLSSLLINLGKEREKVQQKPEIIILDESSMASTHQMDSLLNHAKRLNKRIFLVGDIMQLSAVEAGSPFKLMQEKGLSTVTMKKVVRQDAEDLRWGVNATIRGDTELALKAIGNEAFINKQSDGQAFNNKKSSINVVPDKQSRLKEISNAYLSLNPEDQENTIVLLGSNEDRKIVNKALREGLKEKGGITGQEIHAHTLQSKGLTTAEKQHVYNYEVGDIIRFNKAYRSLNIRRFDYLTVSAIDQENQTLVLNKNGKEIKFSPLGSPKSKGPAIEVYTQEDRLIAKGDYIRWTQNRKNHDIYNTETAKVIDVNNNIATVKIKNGDKLDLDLTESINHHWDYAWSSTVYAAQGKKAQNVIAQLEGNNPNLTNYRSFYVTLSRAVNTINLFVDDLDKATHTIKNHTGEKSNASEFLAAFKQKKQFEKHVQRAHKKLGENIYVYPNKSERLSMLASKYVDLSCSHNTPYLVASDFKDRETVNALIRSKFKEQLLLYGVEAKVGQLRPYHIRSNDQNMKLTPGMVVLFDRSYRKLNVQKGVYYTVADVNEIEQVATLTCSSGQKSFADIPYLVERQKKDISIYKLDSQLLMAGDKIQWTKNYRDSGILKDQQASVVSIKAETVIVKIENSNEIEIKRNNPMLFHWRYAYTASLEEKVKQKHEAVLTHIDEKIKSPKRIEALFGLLGGAKDSAYVYTHSRDYVLKKLQEVTHKTIPLESYSKPAIENTFFQKLEKFKASRKSLGHAWVSYYEAKQNGASQEEKHRNAVILDQAHSEIASTIVNEKNFRQDLVKALGFDVEKLKQYAKKNDINKIIEQYQSSQGISKLKFAYEIAQNYRNGANAILNRAIKHYHLNENTIMNESQKFESKRQLLNTSQNERNLIKILEQHRSYSIQARELWERIYKSNEAGCKPNQSRYDFARHTSDLRNKLAHAIKHDKHYTAIKKSIISDSTINLIEKHSKQFQEKLTLEAKRSLILGTGDWREVVSQNNSQKDRLNHHKAISLIPKKAYWDKDLVLESALQKAESIISSLISEEKNTRKSKGNKIVWGKKNGSVHYHTNGSKAGVVNDYERNIHGDIINYYAKTKGLDWYDAISEIAAITGINPNSGEIKTHFPVKKSQLINEKKILEEQKRRESVKNLAEKTWKESTSIKGTLAETYLKKHRGAKFDVGKLEVRFNQSAPIYGYKGNKVVVYDKKPALIVAFKDRTNELSAVQCTYLDENTANKDKNLSIGKMTIGSQWGNVGEIYKGTSDKVFVAEGAETAMSLIQAEPDASIYITGGNMQNIQHYDFLSKRYGTEELHIVADNDLSTEAGSWKSTEAGVKSLTKQNIRSLIYQPEAIRGQKTDFNDVYKRYGAFEVKKQLYPKYTLNLNEEISDKTKLVEINKAIVKDNQGKNIAEYKIPDMDLKKFALSKNKQELGDSER